MKVYESVDMNGMLIENCPSISDEVAVQIDQLTDEKVKLWVIPSYEREVTVEVPVEGSETGETTTETYIETVPASILYRGEDGKFHNMDSIAGAPGADGVSPTVSIDELLSEDGEKIGVKLSVTDKDSTKSTNILDGAKGEKGDSGKGIVDVVKTGSAGNVDTYTINFTDGTSTTFTVSNGRENEKTSQLENDSGFITKLVSDLANYYTKNETLSTTEITALIEQKANGERVIVDGTDVGKPDVDPQDINSANTYLVKTTNGYSMWAWISNDWTRLGDTDINLSGYYTMGQVDAKFATKTELEPYVKGADLAPVAKSGSYNDLADKPNIPNTDGFATTAQIDSKVQAAQAETEAKIPDVSGFRKKTDTIQYSEISGKPVVDTALSTTSANAVQNKVVTEAINGKMSEITWDGKDIDNPETFLQALKLYVGRVHNPETLESVAPAPFGQSSYILFSEHSSRSYAMQFAFSDNYGLLFAARAKSSGKWYPWTYLNDMSKFDPSALTAAQVTALKAKLGLS